MKALYTSAPGQYGLTNRPKPEPGDGEALIKVIRAGFCANDLRIREGVLTQMGFPFIPGHQYAGIIEDYLVINQWDPGHASVNSGSNARPHMA